MSACHRTVVLFLVVLMAAPMLSGCGKKKKKSEIKPVGLLKTIEAENICPIVETGEWEEIDMAVDSGATESVGASIEAQPGEASRRGVKYEVADGTAIRNYGEKRF